MPAVKTKNMKTSSLLPILVLFVVSIQSPPFAAVINESDVLEIRVQSHEEFSGRYTVSENGTIEYPLIADENIIGLTTSELMFELTYRLAKHIENPLVIVTPVDKPEIMVTVLGQVTNPGPVVTYLGASVQEVIQLAGGPSEWADIEKVKIQHAGQTDGEAEYFNLREFMKKGSLDEMSILGPDDVVVLLSEERNRKVKVIGAVNKPGFFTLEENVNVFELIYLAGGPSEKADLSRVRRFFKNEETTLEEVIDIQKFLDDGNMDKIPTVHEGEVIIVYSRWFEWAKLLAVMNNVLLLIVTIQSLRGAIN